MTVKREGRLAPERPYYLGGVCLITDRTIAGRPSDEIAEQALRAGVRWIQYREKDKTRRELFDEALRLRKLTRKYRAAYIVNDHADIALAVDADGVHLGQDDLPLREARKIMGEKIVGISTHSIAEAVDASEGGADYIGFGPVFRTLTKQAGEPQGVEILKTIKKRVSIPVVAIGGISDKNVRLVFNAEADAVAVASALLSGDISARVTSFMRSVAEG